MFPARKAPELNALVVHASFRYYHIFNINKLLKIKASATVAVAIIDGSPKGGRNWQS